MLYIRRQLRETVLELADKDIDTFIAGGALGFDTLAAQEVIRIRDGQCPHIRLALALPCRDQDKNWSPSQRRTYADIIAQADQVIYTGVNSSREAMLYRDRYMVDRSAYCVCYLNSASRQSGTAYTVRYAQSQRLKLVNLGDAPIGIPETFDPNQLTFLWQ